MKHWIIVMFVAPGLIVLGCQGDWMQMGKSPSPAVAATAPAPATQPADKSQDRNYLAKNVVSKDPDAPPGETAVENALGWANKYSQAMQTVTTLQQENRAQRDKAQALELDNQKLQSELAAAQNELKEANTMLMEMRQELVKWKADVLGFRQEMRAAQQTQLQAMGKMLKLMGGEMPPLATQPAAAQSESATQPTPAPQPASAPAKEPTSAPAP